jgi:hypothetical protein
MSKYQNPDGTYNGVAFMAAMSGLSEDEILWTWERAKALKAAGHDEKFVADKLREEGLKKPWLDKFRCQGWTTKQMQEAPVGAIFVWCNEALSYPRDLARALKRADLRIIAPPRMQDAHRWGGRWLSGVVVDHASRLTEEQCRAVDFLKCLVRTPNK